MASPQPAMVAQCATTFDSAPPATAASRVDGGAAAASGGTVVGATARSKRKRMGTHVVGQGQLPAAGQVGPAAGAPSTPPVRPVAKKPATKPPMVKRAPTKKASLAAINAAAAAVLAASGGHTREVFDEMPVSGIGNELRTSFAISCLGLPIGHLGHTGHYKVDGMQSRLHVADGPLAWTKCGPHLRVDAQCVTM
jgi:hypothetical protein